MADPYEVDAEGNPVAKPDEVAEPDPATTDPANGDPATGDDSTRTTTDPAADGLADGREFDDATVGDPANGTEVSDGSVGDLATGAEAGDPAEQEALRRQVEQTLRFMRIQTVVGFAILLVLIVALSDIRGVMVLVTIVFLLTSLAAYTFLRRTLQARVLRGVPPRSS